MLITRKQFPHGETVNSRVENTHRLDISDRRNLNGFSQFSHFPQFSDFEVVSECGEGNMIFSRKVRGFLRGSRVVSGDRQSRSSG